MTCLFEWNHIKVVKTLEKVLFETAKTGNSRSVSIAHTQPAAPKLERGGATLARALDVSWTPCMVYILVESMHILISGLQEFIYTLFILVWCVQ